MAVIDEGATRPLDRFVRRACQIGNPAVERGAESAPLQIQCSLLQIQFCFGKTGADLQDFQGFPWYPEGVFQPVSVIEEPVGQLDFRPPEAEQCRTVGGCGISLNQCRDDFILSDAAAVSDKYVFNDAGGPECQDAFPIGCGPAIAYQFTVERASLQCLYGDRHPVVGTDGLTGRVFCRTGY